MPHSFALALDRPKQLMSLNFIYAVSRRRCFYHLSRTELADESRMNHRAISRFVTLNRLTHVARFVVGFSQGARESLKKESLSSEGGWNDKNSWKSSHFASSHNFYTHNFCIPSFKICTTVRNHRKIQISNYRYNFLNPVKAEIQWFLLIAAWNNAKLH